MAFELLSAGKEIKTKKPMHEHSISFPSTPSGLCQPICTVFATEAVWDACTILPGLSSNDVCQHGAIKGCCLFQWLTSYNLGTFNTGRVKSNCQ